MAGLLRVRIVEVEWVVVAEREREVADRGPPELLARLIARLAADPTLQLFGQQRHHPSSTANGSISICISGRSSASQINPVDAGHGSRRSFSRTFATSRYRGRAAGTTYSMVFTRFCGPAPAASSTFSTLA